MLEKAAASKAGGSAGLLACSWSGEGKGGPEDPGVGGAWMSGRRLEASPSPSPSSFASAAAWAGATLELRVRLGVRASAPRHENARQAQAGSDSKQVAMTLSAKQRG